MRTVGTPVAALRALLVLAFSGLALAPPAPSAAQTGGIQEEDLPAVSYDRLALERLDAAELEARLARAEEVLNAAGRAEIGAAQARPLLTDLVDLLEERRATGLAAEASRSADDAEHRLLARALARRAQALLLLGEEELASEDLLRMIELRPEEELPGGAPQELTDLFEDLRGDRVGRLDARVTPPDARVIVDGRAVDASGPVAVLAGEHTVRVERPGYAAVEKTVTVRAGRAATFSATLERDSAALILVTRPPGATVTVDGAATYATAGTAAPDYIPPGEAARYPWHEFSAPLLVGDLAPGTHRVEVTRPGFRPYRAQVELPEIRDYETPPILLERTQGVVLLRGLPADAEVRVDGEVAAARRDGAPHLILAPGEHTLAVRHGTAGVFETRFALEDRQTLEVEVRLRPALALLGVLGGDENAARELTARLREALAPLPGWALLDRSAAGPELLTPLGFTAAALRSKTASLDWRAAQAALDRDLPAAVYLLAVLSDDLVATEAEVWLWPAAAFLPGAAPRPDRRRLPLEEGPALASLAAELATPPPPRRPWLGLLLIDSEAAAAPVVAHLADGGPAVSAGLRLGDEVLTLAGTPLTSAARAEEIAAGLEPGEKVAVEARGPGGTRDLELVVASSPAVVSVHPRAGEPDLLYAALPAQLDRLAAGADAPAPWVLELNRAAALLHAGAWEPAVRLLREVRAPAGLGLGRAAVDYWLGQALGGAGPEYGRLAAEALERAAGDPSARLYNNDGPWLAPRARARLRALGGRP